MPKQRISPEMITDAAFKLTRESGAESVTAKKIAEELCCSVQPIYSYFENMDDLKRAVDVKVRTVVNDFLMENIDPEDPFRSIGIAWTRLAQKEPHIVRAFVSACRDAADTWDDIYDLEANVSLTDFLTHSLNIPEKEAKELHLNMFIFTVGLASIYASAPKMSPDDVFDRLSDAYHAFVGFLKRGDKTNNY